MLRTVFVIIGMLMAAVSIKALPGDSTTFKRNSFTPLPVVYFTPETRWAFGATANYNFRFKGEPDSSRASQILVGGAYTQEKQLLFYAPFQLFWDDADKYAFGEIGYYKYFYLYYGTGDETGLGQQESYTVDFPRIRANVTKKVLPNLYLGGQYWFEQYNINTVTGEGELGTGMATGSEGGLVSGYGIISAYDTRDAVYYPYKGMYIENTLHYNPKALGSDFEYMRFRWDARYYKQLPWKHVVALNAFGDHLGGDPPFHLLGMLGGPRRMRGFYEGRFRDRNALIAQAEYRVELPYRLGLVAFGGVGTVAPRPQDVFSTKWYPTGGGGIRFALNKEEHVNLRVDVGFTPEGSAFYLTFGEAF